VKEDVDASSFMAKGHGKWIFHLIFDAVVRLPISCFGWPDRFRLLIRTFFAKKVISYWFYVRPGRPVHSGGFFLLGNGLPEMHVCFFLSTMTTGIPITSN
jgi:hypothetical protein